MEKKQTFNDGLARIFSVDDCAEPGEMPVEGLTFKVALRYHEKTVGVARFYGAMQNGAKVDRVIECPRRSIVSSQDIAVLPDGKQYQITMVQYPEDTVPRTMRLALEVVTQNYEMP